MTDEEIRDIERALWGSEGAMVNHARKLLQTLKAEREAVEIGKRVHDKQATRIAALEAVIDRVKALPPKFSHSDLAPYGRYFANELQAALEQTDE